MYTSYQNWNDSNLLELPFWALSQIVHASEGLGINLFQELPMALPA